VTTDQTIQPISGWMTYMLRRNEVRDMLGLPHVSGHLGAAMIRHLHNDMSTKLMQSEGNWSSAAGLPTLIQAQRQCVCVMGRRQEAEKNKPSEGERRLAEGSAPHCFAQAD